MSQGDRAGCPLLLPVNGCGTRGSRWGVTKTLAGEPPPSSSAVVEALREGPGPGDRAGNGKPRRPEGRAAGVALGKTAGNFSA